MPVSWADAKDAPAMAPARILRSARLAAAGLAALGLLAGCGHGGNSAGTASGGTTSTATTRTSLPQLFPLTGLPIGGATAAASRLALSIKVENTPAARPQSGLDQADMVTEELVEGGITRFFVTFQSHDSPLVGPVRSARTADAALLRQLGGGLFGFAGAAQGVLNPIKATSKAVLLSPDQAPQAYSRSSSRPAPHNLYTSTSRLYQAAARLGAHPQPPPALFRFAARAPAGGRPVKATTIPFSPDPDYTAGWRWDPGARQWDRYQGGGRATVAGGAAVTATNVVVLRVKIGTVPGLVDTLGHPSPDVVLVGKGSCWVLRDGRVSSGTWRRAAIGQATRLVDAAGQPIPLHPGRTWVELEPVAYTPTLR
jgi:Protein of unknown function (DUF3048) N-terminal domain/Protein of unknown function (DUF3048) C-terminal domain